MSELIEYIKDKLYIKNLKRKTKKIHKLIDEYGVFGEDDTYEDQLQFMKDIHVD